MADKNNPTIDKIRLRLEQGYTIEELRALAEDKGLMDDEVTAFFDSYNTESSQKKNSTSDLDLEAPSMDLSVDGGDSDSQESTATETSLGDKTEEAFDQKVEDAAASKVGGALGRLNDETEKDLEEWRKIRSGEKPKFRMSDEEYQKAIQDLNKDPKYQDMNNPVANMLEDEYREYQRKLRIYESTEDDIRQTRLYQEKDNVNRAHSRLEKTFRDEDMTSRIEERTDGHSEGNFIKYDENGKLVVNEDKTAAVFSAIDEATARREAIIAEEVKKLEGYNFIQETGYDFWTGARNFGNGFVAAFNEEQGAVNEYYNSLRTSASFEEAGLTEEDIEGGILGNLAKGNLYAAGTMLSTQTVQQMPQLLGQVAIAYGTAGFGTSISMTASSLAMGVSAYGSTIASYKGIINDEQMYSMAVADAMVEFISERAFTGDVMDMLGKSQLKGMSVEEVRRTMFKKGLFSKEMGHLMATTGAKMADSGGQEFMEELLAGVGGGLTHSIINGEDFSMMEALDGAILGFSSGSTSGSVRASRRLLTGGASALGYGGFRSEILKINSAKQKLAAELRATTDANAKAAIQEKIDGLDKLSVQISQEQSEAYDQYSDKDADDTVSLNRKVKDALIKLKTDKNLTEEQKNELKNSIKESYSEIQKIESKYEGVKADIKKQRETNQEWLNSQETSVEVDENTKLPNTPLMNGIKMVAKALSKKGSKVYIHRNLDDAAEVTGRDKMDLAGANGFFIADDGSVHIMAAQAQQNTAYHEGFHRILRDVDAGYAKRFVDAAFKGMDDATRAKYQKIYNAGMKKGGQALAVEETFAELAADVTAGAISVEGSGTSIVRAAMGSLAKSLQRIGVPVKPNASFKEFANYVNAVVKDFQEGTEATETKGRFGSNRVQDGKFNQRTSLDSLDSKDFAEAKMSKKEIKDYKEGKHLVDKNPDEFGSTVAMDRKLFNNYVETDGYNGRKLAERLVEALESQEAQSELAYRLPILKEMISKGLFENTTVILDRGSMMSTEMDMQSAGGFFISTRDDSIVINMPSRLSADWMAYMLIHEQMHRLTSLELDNTNSVTFKALSLIMDEVSYEGFQNYKATDETRKYNQEDNNRYREARIKREEKGDVKLTSQESAVLASREYGFENVHELVAEAFSNAEFQALLSKIKLSDDLKNQLEGLGIEMKQNLFEQFKEIVKSFLGKIGVPIQNQSILDAVMAVSDNLVSRQKAKGSNGVFFQSSEIDVDMDMSSPMEVLSDGFMPYNSTITDKLKMNDKGLFVFAHTSPNKFDTIKPSLFGKNIDTSKEERMQVGLAGASVAMFGIDPSQIDVGGQYTYQIEVKPSEVYNGVDDPLGIVEQAKQELKAEGKATPLNAVYARATKLANNHEQKFKVIVTPWTNGKLKAQTTLELPVQEYDSNQKFVEPLNKKAPNGYKKVEGATVRAQINEQAKSLSNAIQGAVPSAIKMRIDKMAYSALDGRFGAVNNLDEYVELLETALDGVDLSNPDVDIASARLSVAISDARNFKDEKGYSVRVQSEEAQRKTLENVTAAIANKSEGFTIDPMTGELMTEGVAVGDAKGEVAVDFKGDRGAGINQETIRETIKRALSNPIAAIGGWFNKDDGKFYLDVSEIYDNRETAVRLGVERKEFGVFDMSNGEYIPTNTSEDRDGRDSDGGGGIFFQLSEENLQDDNSQSETLDPNDVEAMTAAIDKAKEGTTEVKDYKGSFIGKETTFTNLATVVEDFKKKNGRAPKILFWMGDQSARGTYTTLDGTKIELEGGISFSQDSKNTDKDVVWATNKNNNEVQGLVKDADIVAIVSGKPETGHRFYKGTWVTIATELMEAFNRKKGETVTYPERGKNFEVTIPQEGFSDPLQAMRFFYETLSENGIDLTNTKEFMQKSAKSESMDSYLAESKGDRMGALNYFLEPSQTATKFFESLGMKPMGDIQNEIRDPYLVENEFTTGDIYAFYEFERNDDGKVVTQNGSHSTYGTDIKGKALGIANRKDNIYQSADLAASTTTEMKLSGKQKLDLLVEAGEMSRSEVDAINKIEDETKRNQAKNKAIRQVSARLKEEGKTDLLVRLSSKGGYVSAKKAGDTSLKRIVSDAGTSYDGQALLESLVLGVTMDSRQEALQNAANELVEEGKAKVREFKQGKKNVEVLSLPVGLVLERANQNQGRDVNPILESVNPETKRKANIFFQSTIVDETSERILLGEKKADIIASLRAKGMSRADANLVYAKASQYAKGAKKGWNEGRRDMSKKHAEERRQARKNESEKSKDLRKKAKAILKQQDKSGDVIIREIINLIKEAGVDIRASQVQTLIRLTKKASRLRGKNAMNPDARYNVFNSVIDKVVAIIEKQETAAGLATYINTLRKVESEQKKLRNRLKKLKASSKSPLISYSEQILDLTSINPSMLSRESLELLEQALKDLNTTTKFASVRKGELSNPYVEIEGIGKVDMRRAKIYFDNIFEQLKMEEVAQNERAIAQEASDRAFENGTDWVAEYDNILRERAEKELKGVAKKLDGIAKEMDLDLDDVNDLEVALELLAEEKKEKINNDKDVLIKDAIIPTFGNFRRLFESHPEFAAIFGNTEMLEDEDAAQVVKNRMSQLSGLELKRLEFAMYDFVVNGKALGISSLRAVVEVKNDSNPALKAMNLKSQSKQGQAMKGLFSRFENTPTFLRRIFKTSEARIAQFMEITGFASLRTQVAIADQVANEFEAGLQRKANELGFNTLAQQTRLQIYSLLSQKPEGMSEAQYLAQVFANLELAYESDGRFNEKQKAEIREVLDEMYNGRTKKNYSELMEMYEGMENFTDMVNYIRAEFEFQQPMMKSYAEEFLGMNFKSEDNYLPIRYRRVGVQNGQIAALQDNIDNVNQAYRSHNMTKAQSQASSTFERNENAMGSKSRYVDLNFFNVVTQSYRENEVKHRTAPSLAKVSAATSEGNETFRNVVTEPEQRAALRKKIVQFLINDGSFDPSEELFPKWMKKSISTLNDLTVLYYFGSVITQTLKQMGAVLNTLTEGNFMDTFGYAYLASTGRLSGDMKRVLAQADIGGRDYIEQVVNLQSAKSTMQGKKLKERMMDLSTRALRSTDKVAATASWLVYYEQHMVNEKGAEKGNWAEWSENIDSEAAAYASTMVAKDQNISTARDKSDFNRINKKSVGSVIQMVVMPFANFLLNKKMNLMLDIRNLGSAETRANAAKSIGGTALEVSAFHAVSQFVIAPMISALASMFTGAGEEEEEDSWYDFEFCKKMFLKGMFSDMNPMVLPIGFIETQYTTALNMIDYMAFEDNAMKHDFSDRTWYENFQAWERANGMPKFGAIGRGDANWVTHLRSAGVYGDMAVEMATSISNISSLMSDNPHYTSTFGSIKYVSPDDAKRLLQLEVAKAGFMLQGAFTGLFSKEVVQTIKSRERQIGKRALSNENENIARIIMQDKELGNKLVQDKVNGLIKDNPTAIEGQVNAMVGEKAIKSVAADGLPSKKNINTIRQINSATRDPRDAAMMAKRVMADLDPVEAQQFYEDLLKYYAVKEGESAVVKIVMILNR